ncbi:MAG TPA: S9 family peptidase [Acidobacteriaceae bacterium]|nr:S9 family peptidase [Acidobacteriaceae bacterium]
MLLRFVLSLFVLLPALSAFAGAQKTTKHPITLDDLAKLKYVGKPVISPKGKWIAYTVRSVDVKADKRVNTLWMVSADGTHNVQLTYGPNSVSNPQWSPDGRWLAFASGRKGEAKGTQVWVLNRLGGEARQLTKVKENLLDYRWSPDSKQLLLTLRAKDNPDQGKEKNGKPAPPKPIVIDRFHFKEDVVGYLTDQHAQLYLFDIATKKLTKLTNDSRHDEREAEWSPDGRLIAYVSRQDKPDPDRFDDPDVFVVDAKPGSTPRKLTTFRGPDTGPLAWSPDSRLIAFRQAEIPGYSIYNQYQLAVIAADGGAPKLLTAKLDRPVGAPVFTGDGKALLATVSDDRNEYVLRVPLNGGAAERMTSGEGVVNMVAAHAGHTVVEWTTDGTIPELYALEDGRLRKLTHQNDALLAALKLVPAENIEAKTKDGNDVHGLLTMPVGYKAGTKVPMLLFIHGGPTAQDAHRFDVTRQLFAAHGFAVLNVNYRGSSGRGLNYSRTIRADWGDKEIIDLLAAVDAAVATGKINPDKMVVGGWSYGGILTDYMIASTTRFKAASSGAGTGELFGMYGMDEYVLQYDNELGEPWKNPALWMKLSYPFFHVERVKTPTLFMGGTRDFNVPLVGGEQMYQALRDVGTPAKLIVYPGQFHGFTRPSFIRDRYVRWFNWYDKYLGLAPKTKSAKASAKAS